MQVLIPHYWCKMLQDYSLYRFVIKEFSNRFLRQFSNIIHAYILPKSNNTKGAFFTRRESNLISFTLMHLAELRKKSWNIYAHIVGIWYSGSFRSCLSSPSWIHFWTLSSSVLFPQIPSKLMSKIAKRQNLYSNCAHGRPRGL